MELRFVGVGGAFSPEMGSNSAFFERADTLFLLDCGEQVFARLMAAGLLPRYRAIVAAVTHLHADHCGSLASLCLYAATVLGIPVTVVYPDEGIRTLLALMGVQPERYALLPSYADKGIRLTPSPARHAPSIPAFSYDIAGPSGTVFYSGDQSVLPPRVLSGLREGSLRHAYLDVNCYDARPQTPMHLPLSDLLEQMEAPLREKCTLMHMNGEGCREMILRAGWRPARVDPIFAKHRPI